MTAALTQFKIQPNGALKEALASVPLFRGLPPGTIKALRLNEGQHNTVYRITVGEDQYALRLAKPLPDEPHFYAREEHNTRIASDSGIGAELLHFDTETGIMVTRFIKGRMMTKKTIALEDNARGVGEALRKLHGLPHEFKSTFDIFDRIERREKKMDNSDVDIPPEAYELRKLYGPLRDLLVKTSPPLVPCHNDGIADNYMDGGGVMHIIDWQCAGQGDPHWEMGALCVQTGLMRPPQKVLFQAYFGGPHDPFPMARINLFKVVCCYYWAVWYFDRFIKGNDEEGNDVCWSRALKWMRFCRARFEREDFEPNREIVKIGP